MRFEVARDHGDQRIRVFDVFEQVVAQHDVERSKVQVGGRSHSERYVIEALSFSPFPRSVHVRCVGVYPKDGTDDLGRGDCVRP